MALKSSPLQYVFAGFDAGIAPHLILLIPTPYFLSLVPGSLGQEASPHSPAQDPLPETSTATQGCSEPPPAALGQTDRGTDRGTSRLTRHL